MKIFFTFYLLFLLQVSNMFILSLALADLTVGVCVMPITSAYAITGKFLCEVELNSLFGM